MPSPSRDKQKRTCSRSNFAENAETDGLCETVIVKAPFVIKKDLTSPRDVFSWMIGDRRSIRVDGLAAAM
ncbi:hypothetical protein LARI1_G008240 [Lachnellula arida]|uniref:Uncharacterized protein n=1 Tax=Lachnellula arida TaxID=1316785 RepID=A0A8T9B1X6_9HELO|nr:hypothetical protein LARI1_G008240 [Lachnellula arida]